MEIDTRSYPTWFSILLVRGSGVVWVDGRYQFCGVSTFNATQIDTAASLSFFSKREIWVDGSMILPSTDTLATLLLYCQYACREDGTIYSPPS